LAALGFVIPTSYSKETEFEPKTAEYRANNAIDPNLESDPLNFGINRLTIMFWYVKLESIGLNFDPRTAFRPVNTRKTRRNNTWHVQ
jgi:hypothetical protein